jgi:hypothetical protein
MVLRLQRIFQAKAMVYRSTQLSWYEVGVLRTFRVFDIILFAAHSIQEESLSANKVALNTAQNVQDKVLKQKVAGVYRFSGDTC